MVVNLHIVGDLEPVVINVISVCVYLAVFKTFFNQTNMDKKHNYTKKNNLLWCLGGKLHLEGGLEPVVGIVVDVKLHMAAIKSLQWIYNCQRHIIWL